ncbi:hypothetical protein [Solimicrobium silvestre]|uniref:Uncharacterized protein n=1 Tax=Solimicrobium silvestre TaxID=2099400 RepID=A0A2S9GSR6_9BURK|nr:hypothetical protein [Solimicrobium silvestre]PRC90753.1 hypothetical protein S2091_4501 [Solimicrobium silvestre]
MIELEVRPQSEKHSGVRHVFIIVQSIIAILLVSVAVGFIMLWLFSVVLSFTPNSVLLPWVAAGVSAFGLLYIFIAAVPGIPGIIWVSRLADHVTPPWDRIFKFVVKIGKISFKVGAIAAILLLVFVIINSMR